MRTMIQSLHMNRTVGRSVTAAVLLVFALAACGGGAGSQGGGDGVIEITASDDLRFDRQEITVKVGDTVTFKVTNSGAIDHEFVLGPESVQMAHEDANMEGMAHGGMDAEGQLAALAISPGQTEEATVTFEEPGELIFGCHIPGHYAAGMRGTVTIEA